MGENEIGADFSLIDKWIYDFLINLGVSGYWTKYVKFTLMFILIALVVYLLQYIVRKILTFGLQRIYKATSFSIIGYALKNRVPHFLALVVPYSFVRGVIPVLFRDFPAAISPLIKLTDIYLVFMVIWMAMAIVRSFANLIQDKEAFRNKPFKSYIQVIQIIFFIFGAIAIFSILTGKPMGGFFAAIGAASAVLLLMFQDTIKGFAASIQLSTNDMLRIGDWITMNKYGADGDVEEINLTTVKVVNFDKTITTIPTYAFISDSFQNWRGMEEAGGRRFTRNFYLNQSDIYFLSDEELENMKSIGGLKNFIEEKQKEYSALNQQLDLDVSLPLNGHKLTNCDLFIRYATWYLQVHPRISKRLTLMVRTLAPTAEGLPVQLYTFTNTTVWKEYEGILAEIINHLLAALPFFKLRIYTTTARDPYDIFIQDKPVQVLNSVENQNI